MGGPTAEEFWQFVITESWDVLLLFLYSTTTVKITGFNCTLFLFLDLLWLIIFWFDHHFLQRNSSERTRHFPILQEVTIIIMRVNQLLYFSKTTLLLQWFLGMLNSVTQLLRVNHHNWCAELLVIIFLSTIFGLIEDFSLFFCFMFNFWGILFWLDFFLLFVFVGLFHGLLLLVFSFLLLLLSDPGEPPFFFHSSDLLFFFSLLPVESK